MATLAASRSSRRVLLPTNARSRLTFVPLAAAALATAPLVAQQPSLGVTADVTAAAFRNQIGRRVSHVCPPTDAPAEASVWGTDVYTFDSAICVAAIHAGVLEAQRPGLVTLTMGPGAAAFTGSTRNGVTTQAYTGYDSSFRFDTTGQPGLVDGATTLRLPASFTAPVVIVCPPIGDFPQPLWGTDVYADDSSICAAAVHAGVIAAAAGGAVSVRNAGRQTSFVGSTRNGVTSQSYTEWPTSFRVSTVTTPAGNPVDPTRSAAALGLIVDVDAQGQASARWNSVSGATYLAARWKIGDTACCNVASAPGAPLTATTWAAGTLTSAGTYGFRVMALTPGGTVVAETSLGWPPPAPATTGQPRPSGSVLSDSGRPTAAPTVMSNAPAAVITVTGSSLLAQVSWSAPPGATSYTLWRRSGASAPVQLTTPPIATTTFTDRVLPGTTYEYQVRAFQPDATYGVSEWAAFTPPLTNPSGFTARQSGNGEATLEWQPVADALEYRVDGAGMPNTGRLVTGTSTLVTPLGTGTYNWQIAAVYAENRMDMATRPTATLAVTSTRLPFLTMNNGPGTAGDASLHMVSNFAPDCTTNYRDCVRLETIFRGFGLNDDDLTNPGDPSDSSGGHLYRAFFADMKSLAAGRNVFCAQLGFGPLVQTLCWAATHGPLPGTPGYGDVDATLGSLNGVPNRGFTLIRQGINGLEFAAFDFNSIIINPFYGTDYWGPVKNSVTLDNEGPKFLPHSCLACHGGQYDAATGNVVGASLLPLDPSQLVFPSTPGRTRGEQEESLRQINRLVLASNPSPAIAEYVRGLYNGTPEVAGTRANDQFVPAGWSQAPELYGKVVKPYCASCHMAMTSRNDFATYENFMGLKERVKDLVCTTRSMPHAEAAFTTFWNDGGTGALPAYLMTALGLGSC